MGQLLRQSGLISALLWPVSELGLPIGFLPAIAFLTCALISTATGTSTGSATAVAPLLMIILMKVGLDLVATLLLCNLGGIPLGTMLDNAGSIGAGLTGMMGMLLYILLLFQVLEMLNASGAFDRLMNGLLKHCKTPRSGEFAGVLLTAVSTAAAGGSSPAIIFCGPMVRTVTKRFHTGRTRGANIMNGTACGISGLLPYGTCCILCLQFAQGYVSDDFHSSTSFPTASTAYSCWLCLC